MENDVMFDHVPSPAAALCIRPATVDDLGRIDALRQASVASLLLPGLEPSQQATMLESTPLDPALVHDGTYYVALVGGTLAACGGWSRRAVLIRTGPQPEAGEDLLDPAQEPAAIRAMYTHPDYARLGLASLVLAASETAARRSGFRRARLIATAPGRKLYEARGWSASAPFLLGRDRAGEVELAVMEKAL
jgi:GNAT superfamily N-acetyltransferase